MKSAPFFTQALAMTVIYQRSREICANTGVKSGQFQLTNKYE